MKTPQMPPAEELTSQDDTGDCVDIPSGAEPAQSEPRGSAAAVLELVKRWLAEDNDYDETVWPTIQQDIEANRLSDRSRFRG